MIRRDALKALVLAAGSRFTPASWTTRPSRPADNPEVSRLARSLPRGQVHLLVAEPNMSPDAVLEPILGVFRETGQIVRMGQPGAIPAQISNVVVLREPDLPTRQLWLELPELGRRASSEDVIILVSWQMREDADAVWLPRFRQAAGWVIQLNDPEFDVPPEVVPSHYWIPVEVCEGIRRISAFSIIESVGRPV